MARLPGFGRRSAARAVLALLREDARLAEPLAVALEAARKRIVCCTRCGAFTVREQDPCAFCTDALREQGLLCVVEDAADVVTMENSGAYKGRYHVLGGKLAPAQQFTPEKLRIAELNERIENESITEVVLALSTDMEGDATAEFLTENLHAHHPTLRVTRLAFGLPADSGVGYSDPVTLKRAIIHRINMI